MFRLRHVLALMTNAFIVGSLLIAVLSLGWVGWVPVFGAIAVGFLLSWPAARILARWIKAKNPAWNEALDRPVAAELRYRKRRDQGMSPTEAQRAARRTG